MKKICLAAVSGAALLGLASFANAQKTGTGSSSDSAASTQCWDVSNNMARDKSQINATGSATTGSTAGTTSGAAGSGSTAGTSGSGMSSSVTASTRPVGMPNC